MTEPTLIERLRSALPSVGESEHVWCWVIGEDLRAVVDALQQISDWARAYPLSVFPEPDFARAREVLTAAGMTLDAISASNMRHVITQVQKIADGPLAPR